MAVRVSPSEKNPSHHASLSDGTTTIGLIATTPDGRHNAQAIRRIPFERTTLKTSTGSTKYSDFTPPYTPVAQDDWTGGRGQEDFETDPTKYYDNWNTFLGQENQVMLGPQMTFGTGYKTVNSSMPGSGQWQSLFTYRSIAVSFVASVSTANKIGLWFRKIGATGLDTIACQLHNNSAGDPGTLIASATGTSPRASILTRQPFYFEFTFNTALTPGTTYWIKIFMSIAGEAARYIDVLTNPVAGTTKTSPDDAVWTSRSFDLYYRITESITDGVQNFFEYKGALYTATARDDGSTPTFFINGDRGVATGAQTTTTLKDTTKAWTVNEWANSIVRITAGGGATTNFPDWRVISSNTADTLTVSPAWTVAPTTGATGSEYVILGTDKWIQRTGHGLTVGVTDVAVADEVIYFAQGDSVNLRRHREYNNAGVWTITDYADDGTNKAVLLYVFREGSAVLSIWRSNNLDGASQVSISKAPTVAWGTNLTFAAAIRIGDNSEKITGMLDYDDMIWVGKEGSLYSVKADVPDKIQVDMSSQRSPDNCKAMAVHSVYLYFSFMDGLEQLFGSTVTDMGPNRGVGMPGFALSASNADKRKGPIATLLPTVRYLFAAVDAEDGQSTIMVWNGKGWFNFWTCPIPDRRIRSLYYQVIPGDTVDRLWVGVDKDIVWLNMPSGTINPHQDSNYRYDFYGYYITSWFDLGLLDVPKYFRSIKIFSEGLSATATVEVEYQTDADLDSGSWTYIGSAFNTSPVQEITIGAAATLTGRRIRFKISLLRESNTATQRILSTVLEAYSRIPVKFQYPLTFEIPEAERVFDLDGGADVQGATTLAQLDTWASSATPLTWRCVLSLFDNKTVLIDPTSLSPLMWESSEGDERHLAQAVVLEV